MVGHLMHAAAVPAVPTAASTALGRHGPHDRLHRLVHTSGGRGRKHRGVIDCRCDDAGTNPPSAQCQSEDGSLTCVYAGRGEDDLVRSCSTAAATTSRAWSMAWAARRPAGGAWPISPPRLLRIKPSLAGIGEHRLARRAVQEDLRNGMRHASKLAREPPRRALACHTANHQKRHPYTGDGSVFLR